MRSIMKATGITAEFNPLHKGHAYVMEEARRLTDCDAVVVAMSGGYVQRGEPAVCDKWARAQMALRCGADLVVEIPTLFCLGNASQYAGAGVAILEALGCSHIAFGSESGDPDLIKQVAGRLVNERDSLAAGISDLLSSGLSYPAARERVYRDMRLAEGVEETDIEAELGLMRTPNDILALEYLMNMKSAEPLAVKRIETASASEIRNALGSDTSESDVIGSEIKGSIPASAQKIMDNTQLTFPDDWTDVLRYAVMSADAAEIEDCPSGGEGLANLLKKAVKSESTWTGIVKAVKSRRYTYTRISRLCMQTVLGITRTDYPYEKPAYIRVLGITDKGRALLSEIRNEEKCSLPVITNINKEAGVLTEDAARLLDLDIHAAYIYNLVTGRDVNGDSDHRKIPVMVSKIGS